MRLRAYWEPDEKSIAVGAGRGPWWLVGFGWTPDVPQRLWPTVTREAWAPGESGAAGSVTVAWCGLFAARAWRVS